MEIIGDLFKFAFCGVKEVWYKRLDDLAEKALPETWTYRNPDTNANNTRTPILENYILHTFRRLVQEYNSASNQSEKGRIIATVGDKLCFNTGLYTKTYETIYAGLRKNNRSGSEPMFLVCFSDTSDPFFRDFLDLPRRAKYFSEMRELIFDTSAELRVNSAHILQNEENRKRLPSDLKDSPYLTTLFNGAIDLAKKKVEANYKAAVPQFYDNQICFLLPICLTNTERADLSLAVRWHNGYYTGHTCLTLDMAYNNARLIACPNSEWLNPQAFLDEVTP